MGDQREDHGDAARRPAAAPRAGRGAGPDAAGRAGRPAGPGRRGRRRAGLSVGPVFFVGPAVGRLFEGGVVTGKGSLNSGAGARVRAVSASRRSAAVSERPGGSAGAGAVPADGAPADGGAARSGSAGASGGAGAPAGSAASRFFGGVRFFRGSRRGGDRGAPEPARHALRLRASRSGSSGSGRASRSSVATNSCSSARATALGGHDRPGRVGGLASRGGRRPAAPAGPSSGEGSATVSRPSVTTPDASTRSSSRPSTASAGVLLDS